MKHHPFDSLPPSTLRGLTSLTNSRRRGDVDDVADWMYIGSQFRDVINERLMGASFPHHHAVIATAPGKVIAGWSLFDVASSLDGIALPHPLAQVGFYVDPAFRRQGIARRLIGEVSKVAGGLGVVQLVASPWNNAGRLLFASVGFGAPAADHPALNDDPDIVVLDLLPARALQRTG